MRLYPLNLYPVIVTYYPKFYKDAHGIVYDLFTRRNFPSFFRLFFSFIKGHFAVISIYLPQNAFIYVVKVF